MKKLLVGIFALFILAGCALPGQSPSAPVTQNHPCAAKVVQSITTDKAVTGLWNCLTPTLQTNVKASGAGSGDGVFTDGNNTPAVPIISVTDVGESGGVDTYVVVVTYQGTQESIPITLWLDSNGLVDNIGFAKKIF